MGRRETIETNLHAGTREPPWGLDTMSNSERYREPHQIWDLLSGCADLGLTGPWACTSGASADFVEGSRAVGCSGSEHQIFRVELARDTAGTKMMVP